MNIDKNEIVKKLAKVAEKLVPPEEAEYFADEVVETHIRKSPDTSPIRTAINDLEASLKNKESAVTYDVDLPSFISVNFHSQGPLVYIKRIHDELENRANENGIAMMAFTNSQAMHVLHVWVQGLAKRGLMAIAVCNGGPAAVVPFNGTKGLFGTNPMAYGFPGEGDQIHCVDMATAESLYYSFLDIKNRGGMVKKGVAVDQNGEPTTNPADAIDYSQNEKEPITNLLSIGGGYKGYYLTYLLEIMTSALIGAPASTQMSSDYVPEEHGSILIVFSPKAMGGEEHFRESIKSLHSSLKTQRAKKGESIRIAGEANNGRFENTPDIVSIDEKSLDKLKKLIS